MSIFSTFLEVYFTGQKCILFYPEYQKIFLSGPFLEKNHGLTPLQNVDFFYFPRISLFGSKKNSLLTRIKKMFLYGFFDKNHRLTPLQNVNIFSTFLEVYFTGPKCILFYPEYQKIFLSGFFDSKKKHMKETSIF